MARAAETMALMLAACAPAEPPLHTDTFVQGQNGPIDVLWVLDDSNSMSEEQGLLAGGFDAFADPLEAEETDFHVGVITTSFVYNDPERAALVGEPPVLVPSPGFRDEFSNRTIVGIGGSDKERGLGAATHAVGPDAPSTNAGFVREDADLLVIVLSDEEDCSDDGALEGEPATACYTAPDALPAVEEWVARLGAAKGDPARVRVAAIISGETPSCPDVYWGSRYEQAAALTGGLVADICATAWEPDLARLGALATGVNTSFRLTQVAIAGTIAAEIDGSAAAGWSYEPATGWLTFAEAPPRGAEIRVSYVIPGR